MSDHDISALDHPAVLGRLFFARREPRGGVPVGLNLGIPVDGETLGARFHPLAPEEPTLLFFHGNGEIVADYDDFAPLFAAAGWNFLAVDFRGYGRSTGRPSASTLLSDAHRCFDYARDWLADRGYRSPLAVMGRSLGSAPALELASRRGHPAIAGLMLESAFAKTTCLLETLGIAVAPLGLSEASGFRNLEKIQRYSGPTLLLHGCEDDLIPLSEAEALFEASPARQKRLVVIRGADHNTLLAVGPAQYREALGTFAAWVAARR